MGLNIVTRKNSYTTTTSSYRPTYGRQINYTANKPHVQPKPPVAHIEPDIDKIYLPKLGLSTRALNALHDVNIWTIGDLAKLTREEIKAIPRIGATAISEIETSLIKNNLYSKTKLCSDMQNDKKKPEPNIEIYDKSEMVDYRRPQTKREFKIYTWIYLEGEDEATIERYKRSIADKFRERYPSITENDEVTIVWNEYLPQSLTKMPPIELPKYADIRLFALSKSLEAMSVCKGYVAVLGGKMMLPTQVQLEMNCWINSCIKPEMRAPLILHKEQL